LSFCFLFIILKNERGVENLKERKPMSGKQNRRNQNLRLGVVRRSQKFFPDSAGFVHNSEPVLLGGNVSNLLFEMESDDPNTEICFWCNRPLPVLTDGSIGDCPKCHPESYGESDLEETDRI
jgi:hypothetical protein